MSPTLAERVRLRRLTVVEEGDGALIGEPDSGTYISVPPSADRRLSFLVFETDLSQLLSVPRRQCHGPQLAGLALDMVMLAVLLAVELAVPVPVSASGGPSSVRACCACRSSRLPGLLRASGTVPVESSAPPVPRQGVPVTVCRRLPQSMTIPPLLTAFGGDHGRVKTRNKLDEPVEPVVDRVKAAAREVFLSACRCSLASSRCWESFRCRVVVRPRSHRPAGLIGQLRSRRSRSRRPPWGVRVVATGATVLAGERRVAEVGHGLAVQRDLLCRIT